MFNKILIANRGEIACRIIKTAKKLGIKTVAVYSNADIGARHVRLADEAVALGGYAASESYLDYEKVLNAAKETGAEAIHPGYGFLSENAEFAKECKAAGIVFIGPSPEAILAMGLKDSAKKVAIDAGVAVVPGYMGDDQSLEKLGAEAQKIGFPLLIKAIAGGGGRGIRRVDAIEDLERELAGAKREAIGAFGDDRVMLEKLILRPRHIEVQVFGDNHGNVVHLFDRDCSVQRRRQKLIEEAPAPNVPEEVRRAMFDASVKIAKAVNYSGAGTVEFIVDGNGEPRLDGFWFLEMNTRLQVEHPVTEMVTGLDLVEWQLRVAAGEKLPRAQDEITCSGHAIEARIIAEDPNNGFMPSSGKIEIACARYSGMRIDTGYDAGDLVSSHYDSLIEKWIHWAEDDEEVITEKPKSARDWAISGLASDLAECRAKGAKTNIGYLLRILELDDFNQCNLSTNLLEENSHHLVRCDGGSNLMLGVAACALMASGNQLSRQEISSFSDYRAFRSNASARSNICLVHEDKPHKLSIEENLKSWIVKFVDNSTLEILKSDIFYSRGLRKINNQERLEFITEEMNEAREYPIEIQPNANGIILTKLGEKYDYLFPTHDSDHADETSGDDITANLPGKIAAIDVTIGQLVKAGEVVIVLEAMKMEHSLKAPRDGVIAAINVEVGAQVKLGDCLISLEAEA